MQYRQSNTNESNDQVSPISGIYDVGIHLVQSKQSLQFFPVEVRLDTTGKRAQRYTVVDTKMKASFAQLVDALKGINSDSFGGDSCELKLKLPKNALKIREFRPTKKLLGTVKPVVITGFHVDFGSSANNLYGKVAVLDVDGRTNFVTTVTKRLDGLSTSPGAFASQMSAVYDEVQGTAELGSEGSIEVVSRGNFVFFKLSK